MNDDVRFVLCHGFRCLDCRQFVLEFSHEQVPLAELNEAVAAHVCLPPDNTKERTLSSNDYPKLDRNTRGPSHQGETSRQAQEALNEIDRLRLENEQLRNGIQVRLIAERVVRTLLAEALPVVLTAVERSTPAHADDREWTRTVAVPMAQRALAASIALDKAELTEHERWIFR